MAAAASGAPPREQREQREQRQQSGLARDARKVEKRVSPLLAFWTKVSNDWIFNWSSMLAYVFLTSIFPILLVIVAIGGLILGVISPEARATLETNIANGLPGGAGGAGGNLVKAATRNLNQSASALLILGIVLAVVSGSGLFVSLENVFGVIFRLRGRDMLHQRLMAIGMLLLYAILIPIIILASILPPAVLGALGIGNSNPVSAFLIQAAGIAVAFVVAALLFGAIYVVVPNRPVKFSEVWKGTLVAAALLVVYEIIFPIYESMFLHPNNYGAVVGFAVVILAFFYYLAFILLLGAEVNSWASGQRQTAGPIDAILHEVQAHNTTRGVAGPTAGSPQEDLQDGKGAAAMATTRDAIQHERKGHSGDQQPPKYAESGATGAGYHMEGDQTAIKLGNMERHSDDTRVVSGDNPAQAVAAVATRSVARSDDTHVRTGTGAYAGSPAPARQLTTRQKRALSATLAAGVVAVAPVVRFLGRLVTGGGDHGHPAAD
ncbi:MAG TPA: YihY/virulence factor BrkB family protein [Ktedonobacterales bacterium]|nr:YihY/virulence factor BrkB family protein [Ktedonobacterales bacterium]